MPDIISLDLNNPIEYNKVRKINIFLFNFILSYIEVISKSNGHQRVIYYLFHIYYLSINFNIIEKLNRLF